MNKTLLLVICDFLLLNLLALTHWEKAEPVRPALRPAAPVAAAGPDQDLVDVMKLSLDDERRAREQLAQQLQTREQTLAQLSAEKGELEQNLATTRHSAQELGQRLSTVSQDAVMTKERLAALQRELEDGQREAARQQQELAALAKEHAEARQKIENLNVTVKVAEEEKKMLRETADTLKQQVTDEREERRKVLAQAGTLAEGVGRLAEKSGELTKEIRENRPVNANTLFSDFLANRVQAGFTAVRSSFLGPIVRQKDPRTLLVADGTRIYALLHVTDTPFSLKEPGADWEKFSGTLGRPAASVPVPALTFLALDPRIVVVPLDPARAAALGVRIYQTALDPFKFTEAVLISSGGRGYGEIAFKIDPQLSQYVRMDNRFFKRLFGDFTPSAGDLVLSKTGELLGIMVNDDYCAVLNNFLPTKTIVAGGNIAGQHTAKTFDALAARLRGLPLKLQ